MVEWADDATIAIKLCKEWAERVRADIDCTVYLFGSAIYDGGDQFDAQLSDLDLVVHFDEELAATERVHRLVALLSHKLDLELQMIPRLHRTNCEDAGVSVLPTTTFELQANIHKGKSRHFFNRNIFLDLHSEAESVGLPGAGSVAIPDEARQALEHCQELRNRFLAVSANATGGLAAFDGADPLPKAMTRAAAQLVPATVAGSWYDTRIGLELLFEELSGRRSESQEIGRLFRTISKRRGGRGRRPTLKGLDQLLANELLYDRAAASPHSRTAIWEIRFAGASSDVMEQTRLLNVLRALAPDAEIVGLSFGSIIVRVSSSLQSFERLQKLQHLGALAKVFETEEVELRLIEGEKAGEGFQANGLIDQIAARIAKWRPEPGDSAAITESKLAAWLEEWLHESGELAAGTISREAIIEDGAHLLRADLLIRLPGKGVDPNLREEQRILIEVVRLRHRRDFFTQVERLERASRPVILVLLGTSVQLADLGKDIRALTLLGGSIRVVTALLDG